MAIGIARMLGVELSENFRGVFKAKNFREFWQRWHITLSTFLRDYLYIPLGGNPRGRSCALINLMLVMLIGGLWYGASVLFLIWGCWHGLLLISERLLGDRHPTPWLPKPLALLFTYCLVLLGLVAFRSELWDAALQI